MTSSSIASTQDIEEIKRPWKESTYVHVTLRSASRLSMFGAGYDLSTAVADQDSPVHLRLEAAHFFSFL